jgi:hypothetical protein
MAHLGIFENIVGSDPALAERLILKTKLLPWILNRIKSKTHEENRGYAAELLSILLQESRSNRLELGKTDGVETLLTVASASNTRAVARHLKLIVPSSNSANEIPWMPTSRNTWRTSSTRFAPR